MVSLYLDQITSGRDRRHDPDPATQRERQCEAYFYIGEYLLTRQSEAEAPDVSAAVATVSPASSNTRAQKQNRRLAQRGSSHARRSPTHRFAVTCYSLACGAVLSRRLAGVFAQPVTPVHRIATLGLTPPGLGRLHRRLLSWAMSGQNLILERWSRIRGSRADPLAEPQAQA